MTMETDGYISISGILHREVPSLGNAVQPIDDVVAVVVDKIAVFDGCGVCLGRQIIAVSATTPHIIEAVSVYIAVDGTRDRYLDDPFDVLRWVGLTCDLVDGVVADQANRHGRFELGCRPAGVVVIGHGLDPHIYGPPLPWAEGRLFGLARLEECHGRPVKSDKVNRVVNGALIEHRQRRPAWCRAIDAHFTQPEAHLLIGKPRG